MYYISVAAYTKNFTIGYTEKKWQIAILKPLDSDTVEKNKQLKIPVVATESNKFVEGHAVLIMNLPVIKGPEFNENVYVAEYPETGKGVIKFSPDLKFKNAVDVTSVDLSGKYINSN